MEGKPRFSVKGCVYPSGVKGVEVNTTFDIMQDKPLHTIMEEVDGVEKILWCHKYNFTAYVGNLFDPHEVARVLAQKLDSYIFQSIKQSPL